MQAANLVNPNHEDPHPDPQPVPMATVEIDTEEREAPTGAKRGVATHWPHTPKYPAHVPAVHQADKATQKPVPTETALGDKEHWPDQWTCRVGRSGHVQLSHEGMLQTWWPIALALAREAGLPQNLAEMTDWRLFVRAHCNCPCYVSCVPSGAVFQAVLYFKLLTCSKPYGVPSRSKRPLHI